MIFRTEGASKWSDIEWINGVVYHDRGKGDDEVSLECSGSEDGRHEMIGLDGLHYQAALMGPEASDGGVGIGRTSACI